MKCKFQLGKNMRVGRVEERKVQWKMRDGGITARGFSSLRRGIGLKRSSREKVRAAEPCVG